MVLPKRSRVLRWGPRPADVISDERFAYDSAEVGTAPVRGRVTLHQEVEYYNGTGLTTKTTVTSPDPDGSGALTAHRSVTDLDPVLGVPVKITDPNDKVTSGTYDGLGRLRQVWEPGRVQGTDTPNTKYLYMVRSSGMNAVKTETLNHDGSAYVASRVIYDGLLRQRQSQSPSASASEAGRVISESFYDSRGLAQMVRDGWSATGAAVTTLLTSSAAVDSRVLTRYDGAGRAISETFQVGEGTKPDNNTSYLEKWTTTTAHSGDRTDVNPPTGGVPTTTLTDARGNTTELRQYTGASLTGTHHVTSYTYDHADRLKKVTDPEGNMWSYGYDLRGRQVSASDPDKGDSATVYDDAGQVVTSTDARGEKLGYTYDALGRKTSLRDDSPTGAKRASWSYDLLGNGSTVKGQLASSTRTADGVEYTTSITGYTDRYQPTGQTMSIPDSLGALSGDYTTELLYTEDGRVRWQSVPAAGGLGRESLTTFFSATNAADGLTGGFGAGAYVLGADYLPTGETSWLRTGNTYDYQQAMYYGVGTRRLESVTTTLETGNAEDELHDLQHASYSYDAAGNVLSVKDTPDPALGGRPSDQQCFTYDWARRLTNAWTPQNGDCAPSNRTVAGLGGADPYWKSYSYDVLGNRTASVLHRTAAAGGDVASTYARPASGADSVRPHAVTSVTAKSGSGTELGVSSFAYDGAGNMTGRTVAGAAEQVLTWDAEGELASVSSDENGDGSVAESESDEFVYSADGDRLVRTQDGDTTVYLPGQEITLDGDTGAVSAKRYYTFA
ncbi:hypothetical protein, partial [Promicromonospora iranensis]